MRAAQLALRTDPPGRVLPPAAPACLPALPAAAAEAGANEAAAAGSRAADYRATAQGDRRETQSALAVSCCSLNGALLTREVFLPVPVRPHLSEPSASSRS